MTNILLVEDNRVNRAVILAMLSKANYVVEHAEDGQQAVSLVQSYPAHHYACILMDLQMPVMDGFTAARTIRSLGNGYRDIPIIAVTANMIDGIEERIQDAGMNLLLPKPVHYETLIKSIERETTVEFTL